MKRKNIFWGILCLALAVLIILTVTGTLNIPFLSGVSSAKMIWSIILFAILIGSLSSASIEGTIISAGILVKLYDKELGFNLSIPVLIAILVLLIMAFHFLFPGGIGHKKPSRYNGGPKEGPHPPVNDVREENNEYVNVRSTFNGVTRYINSPNFKRAEIESAFGGIQLYLNGATVPSGRAEIDINSKFSGVEIFIPYNWNIINHVNSTMGAVTEVPIILRDGEVSPVDLILTGSAAFCGVDIKRI